MESSLKTASEFINQIDKLERQLLNRYLSVVSLAQVPQTNRDQRQDDDDEKRFANRNQAAYDTLKMDVETAGVVRAAEDLLILTRRMKELWLFGQLNTVRASAMQDDTEENAAAVAQMLGEYVDKRGLTLIVAATLEHGIGQNGKLPWPMLKGEMAYFARVTKRTSAPLPQSTMNAVIMGRKTWESIPVKFRPLKDRVNLVISETMQSDSERSVSEVSSRSDLGDLIIAKNLQEGIDVLDRRGAQSQANRELSSGSDQEAAEPLGNIFVIGGASIYAAALQLPRAYRVLLTKIQKPTYECDTFFPIDLESKHAKEQGWHRRPTSELEVAIGETLGISGAIRQEGEVEYEFCLYERDYGG